MSNPRLEEAARRHREYYATTTSEADRLQREHAVREDLETLESCPCGRVPECVLGPNLRQVVCGRCGRRGPAAASEWLAIKLWNNDRNGTTT